MASHVERVLDYMEKLIVNPDIPKELQEDLQWAVDTISLNKLYKGGMEGFKLQENLDEVKAWTDMIYLRNIAKNKDEESRLRMMELEHLQQSPGGKRIRKGASDYG